MTLEIIIKISMDTTLTTDKMAKTLALDKTTIAISLATTTAMTDSSSREGTMEIILEDSKMVRTMTPLVQTLVVATTTAITDSSREVNSLATATTMTMTDCSREETVEIMILEDSKLIRTMAPLVQALVINSLATTTVMTDREGTIEIMTPTLVVATTTATTDNREGTLEIITPTLVVATTTAITDSSREEEDNKEATASLSLVTDFQLREFSQARTMGSQTLDRRTSHLLLTLP